MNTADPMPKSRVANARLPPLRNAPSPSTAPSPGDTAGTAAATTRRVTPTPGETEAPASSNTPPPDASRGREDSGGASMDTTASGKNAALRWGSILHHDDADLVRAGMDPTIVAALRVRREMHFHHVEGPVDSGTMTSWDRLSYSAPSFSTVPLTLLISVYGIQVRLVCVFVLTLSATSLLKPCANVDLPVFTWLRPAIRPLPGIPCP